MRIRWAALVAALALFLSAAGNAHVVVERAPLPAIAADGSGSISTHPEPSGLSFAAVELARPLLVARSESQAPLRALAIALLAVVLLVAAVKRRCADLRRLLELSIRSQSQWWRPAPGGRAPPRALPL